MSRSIIAVTVLAVALFTTGCATGFIQRGVNRTESCAEEFSGGTFACNAPREVQLPDPAKTPPYCGCYVGETERNGIRFSRYQFADILAGSKDRVLEILIPQSGSKSGVLLDKNSPDQSLDKAFLLPRYFGSWIPDKTIRMQWIEDGRFSETGQAILMRLDCDSGRFMAITVDATEYDSFNPTSWRVFDMVDEIQWKKRSLAKVVLWRMGYCVSVPVDIATGPLQFLSILIYWGGIEWGCWSPPWG